MSLNGEKKNAELMLFMALREYVETIAKETTRSMVARIVAEEREKDENPPREPVVYFIQAHDGGAIKIGVAVDTRKRLSELQRTSPVPLRILATSEGGYVEEKRLHKRFADQRLHGEWFTASDELVAHIQQFSELEEAVA